MKCYLCNARVIKFLTKNGFTIYRCDNCGLARTDLQKDYFQFVESHYNKGYFTGDPTRSAYVDYKDDKKFIVKNLNKFLEKVRKYKPSGKLLDVGCALGFLVELARSRGYDAYGFDASTYAVEEASELVGSKRIQHGIISKVHYEKKSFDVITMFDIFEHLDDPRADLRKIFSWLKDDGILIIATGDTESVLSKLLGRKWTFYIPPQHLFFFNKKNLSTLLDQEHLKPIEWFRIAKWLSLRYVLHLARTTGESRLAQLVYPFARRSRAGKFPVFIPARDNMVVIAKKQL